MEIPSGHQMLFQPLSLLLFLWRGMFGSGISPDDSLEDGANSKKNLPPLHVNSDSMTKLEVRY